jgi:hypothetical protein
MFLHHRAIASGVAGDGERVGRTLNARTAFVGEMQHL